MELKEFVQNVLTDLIDGVEEVRNSSQRDLRLSRNVQSNQTIEFDIALTVEEEKSNTTEGKLTGKGNIKVASINGNVKSQSENSNNTTHTSRIKFGVYVDERTNDEKEKNSNAARQAMTDLTS